MHCAPRRAFVQILLFIDPFDIKLKQYVDWWPIGMIDG